MATKETTLSVPAVFKIADMEINAEILQAKIAEDTKHTITGVNDTAGYKQAVAFRALYRTTRTTLAKVIKEMSQPHKDYLKGLKDTNDKLAALALSGEEYFDGLIIAVENEKERIKQEKIIAEQRKLQVRINELNVLGAMFDGETYTFGYDEALAVGIIKLKEYTDGEFIDFLEDVKTSWVSEQSRIENENLLLQQQEQQRQEEIERQNLLTQQNKAQATALDAKRLSLRLKELKLLGGTFDSETGDCIFPSKGDLIVIRENIEGGGDNWWDELVYDIENFVPATEPLVKEAPEIVYDGASLVSLNDIAMDIASNPPKTDYSAIQQLAEELSEEVLIDHFTPGNVICSITFGNEKTHIDFDVSSKLFMRVYPDEFEEIAMAGAESANAGIIQPGLNWALIKRM